MSAATPRLVYMANQIASAFRVQGVDRAVVATYEHLRQFWDPWMIRLIVEHLAAGGAELNDIAREAIGRLAERTPAAP